MILEPSQVSCLLVLEPVGRGKRDLTGKNKIMNMTVLLLEMERAKHRAASRPSNLNVALCYFVLKGVFLWEGSEHIFSILYQ